MEVIDHDLGLAADSVVVPLDVAAQLLLGAFDVVFGVVLNGFHQPVVARNRRVLLQHVENEPFLDGLLHGVAVERPPAGHAAGVERRAEDFQRLVLGCGGEGEVAGIGQQFARLHDVVDLVLVVALAR